MHCQCSTAHAASKINANLRERCRGTWPSLGSPGKSLSFGIDALLVSDIVQTFVSAVNNFQNLGTSCAARDKFFLGDPLDSLAT